MSYNTESSQLSNKNSSEITQKECMLLSEKLIPVSDLNTSNRTSLCKSSSIMHLQQNDQIKLDTIFRSLVYVIEGSVTIYNGKTEITTIAAGSKEARQALSLDQAANQAIRTRSMAKLIRFGREQLEILLKEQEKAATHVIERQVSTTDNLVFDSIVQDMQRNSVTLCSFSDTAQKIMKSVKTKSMDIPNLASIIQSDPGLAAHIVFAASRADGTNSDPVQTIRGAITRLGVESTVKMAMELPMRHAVTSDNPIIIQHLKKYQHRSTRTAAICQSLAQQIPNLKPDMALLAGLTADLGELLVVTYAARFNDEFDTYKKLHDSVENLREIVGSWLLNSWGFSAAFVDTTCVSRNWYRSNTSNIQYCDLVTAALLIIQGEFPDEESSSIPNSANLLITRRLLQEGINLNDSKEILQMAGQQLSSPQDLLKAS